MCQVTRWSTLRWKKLFTLQQTGCKLCLKISKWGKNFLLYKKEFNWDRHSIINWDLRLSFVHCKWKDRLLLVFAIYSDHYNSFLFPLMSGLVAKKNEREQSWTNDDHSDASCDSKWIFYDAKTPWLIFFLSLPTLLSRFFAPFDA